MLTPETTVQKLREEGHITLEVEDSGQQRPKTINNVPQREPLRLRLIKTDNSLESVFHQVGYFDLDA